MRKVNYLVAITMLLIAFTARADQVGQDVVLELGKGIKVTLIEKKFDPKRFKIKYCKDSKVVCLINGQSPFGSAHTMPKTRLAKLKFQISEKVYDLDTANMYNAWGNRPLEVKGGVKYMAAHCYNSESCTLRGLFSDAAGSFVAEWQIRGGVSTRTILTDSSDVVNMFLERIDPPVFE